MTKPQINVSSIDSNDERPEVDLLDVLRSNFENGNGVISLHVGMSDTAIIQVIKQAASFGKPFKVVPAAIPVDDSHHYAGGMAASYLKLSKTGMFGPFNQISDKQAASILDNTNNHIVLRQPE